jgi:hypothetical protein
MVQVVNLDDVIRGRGGTLRRPSDLPEHEPRQSSWAADDFSFWPEVSSRPWVSKGSVLPDPRNSPERVFREVFLILGGTGLLVLLAGLVFGVPS